jgi:hypothetical protein
LAELVVASPLFSEDLFSFIPREVKETNVALMLECVRHLPKLYTCIPDQVRAQSEEMAALALQYNTHLYNSYHDFLIPQNIKERSVDLAMYVVGRDVALYRSVPLTLRQHHRELAARVMRSNTAYYQYIPENLREAEPQWALQALRQNKSQYQFVPLTLRDRDDDVQFMAVDVTARDYYESFGEVKRVCLRNLTREMTSHQKTRLLIQMYLHAEHHYNLLLLERWPMAARMVRAKKQWVQKWFHGRIPDDIMQGFIFLSTADHDDDAELIYRACIAHIGKPLLLLYYFYHTSLKTNANNTNMPAFLWMGEVNAWSMGLHNLQDKILMEIMPAFSDSSSSTHHNGHLLALPAKLAIVLWSLVLFIETRQEYVDHDLMTPLRQRLSSASVLDNNTLAAVETMLQRICDLQMSSADVSMSFVNDFFLGTV